MDASEKLAHAYFKYRKFNSVIFEPQGKSKPPDFLLEGRIAVEVRRLNRHEVATSPTQKRRGLEEVVIPAWDHVKQLLPSLGAPTAGVTWFVEIRHSGPRIPRPQLQRAVRKCLEAFRDSEPQNITTIRLFENFTLRLVPAGWPHSDCFVMGGRRSSYWVVPELERNLKICIDEKTLKTSAIREKYPEWWLVLIDRINFGDKEALQVSDHNWDKIILIDPDDHTRAFVV